MLFGMRCSEARLRLAWLAAMRRCWQPVCGEAMAIGHLQDSGACMPPGELREPARSVSVTIRWRC
jgi:hypothetical protein